MRNSKARDINNSLGDYYASSRAHAIINNNNNKDCQNISQDLEIGRVFAEYKDKLVIIEGEIKKSMNI